MQRALEHIANIWIGAEGAILTQADILFLKTEFAKDTGDPALRVFWEGQLDKLPLGVKLDISALEEASLHPVLAHTLGSARPGDFLEQFGARYWTKNMQSYRLRRPSSAGAASAHSNAEEAAPRMFTSIQNLGDLPTYTAAELDKDQDGRLIAPSSLFLEGLVDLSMLPEGKNISYKYSRIPSGWIVMVARPPAAPSATASSAASGLQKRPNETDDAWTDVSEDDNGDETAAVQRQMLMAQIARLDPQLKRAKPAEPTLPSALAPHRPAPVAPVALVSQADEDDASPNSVPRDDAKVFYNSILAVPSTAYDDLPEYVISRQKKEDLYRQALYYSRSHPYRLDRQAEQLKKLHGFNLDLVEIMKVLTGHHVSAVDADNLASSDLFYMFQASSGAKFYGIEAMIQSKAVLLKKMLTPAGHTEALMDLERLEGVVFNSHQGRDWHHYTRFLRELAKDPSLGFDFMVLYDDKFRRKLADRSSSIYSLLEAKYV